MGERKTAKVLRLADDVHATLTKAAKGAGMSATKLGDQLLRNALDAGGVPTTGGRRMPPAPPPKPSPANHGRTDTESLTGAGTRRSSKDAGAGCRHPIGRRIGNSCAACGATVKA